MLTFHDTFLAFFKLHSLHVRTVYAPFRRGARPDGFVSQAQQFTPGKLDSLLNSLAANKKMMGSLSLSHKGKVVYSRTFGYAQTEGAAPILATVFSLQRGEKLR